MRRHGALLEEELVEVLAAGGQHGLVGAVLLPFDQQRDVTELVADALLVQFVQHGLAVFGQELVHLSFAVHLKTKTIAEQTAEKRLEAPQTRVSDIHSRGHVRKPLRV